jgi:hypothetical protein
MVGGVQSAGGGLVRVVPPGMDVVVPDSSVTTGVVSVADSLTLSAGEEGADDGADKVPPLVSEVSPPVGVSDEVGEVTEVGVVGEVAVVVAVVAVVAAVVVGSSGVGEPLAVDGAPTVRHSSVNISIGLSSLFIYKFLSHKLVLVFLNLLF